MRLVQTVIRRRLGAGRWSWQLFLAILVALTPLLAVAPAVSRRTAAGAQPRSAVASVPRSPPADHAVGIVIDGQPLAVAGRVEQGVALAPADALAQAMGGFVEHTRTAGAQIFLGQHVFTATAESPTLEVDGQPQALAVGPRMIGGQLYVPVRAITAAMGYALDWLQQTATVAIDTKVSAPPAGQPQQRLQPPPAAADERSAAPAPVVPYTDGDLNLIGRVIHGEADDEPFLARVGVAAVILHRVRAAGFPKTIAGVIYDPDQFQAVGAPLFEQGPNEEDLTAALAALHGQDPTAGALFFYNPVTTWSGSWIFTRHTLVTYGDIRFAI